MGVGSPVFHFGEVILGMGVLCKKELDFGHLVMGVLGVKCEKVQSVTVTTFLFVSAIAAIKKFSKLSIHREFYIIAQSHIFIK